MNYLEQNRRGKNRIHISVKIIACIVIVFALFKTAFVSRIVHTITAPLFSVSQNTKQSLENSDGYFTSKKKLQQENELLQKENARLTLDLLRTDAMKKQLEELQALTNTQFNVPEKSIAQIINRPPFSPYDTFVILHTGNVLVGDLVYIEDVRIGTIVEVNMKTAIVQLFSSSNVETHITIGEFTGTAIGQGAGTFVVSVPKETTINKRDLITLIEDPFRPFSVVGEIEEIESDSFKKVYFRIPLDLKSFTHVRIVAPYDEIII